MRGVLSVAPLDGAAPGSPGLLYPAQRKARAGPAAVGSAAPPGLGWPGRGGVSSCCTAAQGMAGGMQGRSGSPDAGLTLTKLLVSSLEDDYSDRTRAQPTLLSVQPNARPPPPKEKDRRREVELPPPLQLLPAAAGVPLALESAYTLNPSVAGGCSMPRAEWRRCSAPNPAASGSAGSAGVRGAG